jgi:hypothetical protein
MECQIHKHIMLSKCGNPFTCSFSVTNKGKAVPLQAWSGPEGSRKLRFPDFMTKVKQCRYRPGVAQRVPGS